MLAGALVAAACGGSQPDPEPPAPQPIDSTAIKEQMRRDSIAAAERARAEAERRAAEERARREAELLLAFLTAELQERIHFDFDRSDIRNDDMANLDRKAAIMLANRNPLRMRIAGHTDERGSDEYNLALGNRRAESAKRYLVNKGIDASRVAIVSFGEERPLNPASTEDAWAQNRRSEFEVTAGGGQLVAPSGTTRQEVFLAGALRRFQSDGISEVSAAVNAVNAWRRGEISFEGTSLTILKIAEANEVTSQVTIRTRRNGQQTTGAVIKYRFTDVDRERIAGESTVVKTMTIGIYNIWSERNGSATSPTDAEYDIWEAQESVLVIED